jgi:uncharacterized protein YecE (DUF72 family)
MSQVVADDPLVRRLADDGLLSGIAAWTQSSLAGPLYPSTVKTPEERLQHYARRFPITEVDSTFYRPLAESTAALWASRTPAGFTFDRYNYRRRELAEWVPRIRLLHEGGRPVHVLMNNCADGSYVRNAGTLARLLAEQLE